MILVQEVSLCQCIFSFNLLLELVSRTHPAMQRERLWELLAERGLEG